MRKRISQLLFSLLAIVALGFAGAPTASASDWGGYADPAQCGGNIVAASTSVDGRGVLQIKWSYGCPGNYARFYTNSGERARKVAISIHSQVPPYNKAGADETNTSVAYTRIIQIGYWDRACAYLDVTWANGDKSSKVFCY